MEIEAEGSPAGRAAAGVDDVGRLAVEPVQRPAGEPAHPAQRRRPGTGAAGRGPSSGPAPHRHEVGVPGLGCPQLLGEGSLRELAGLALAVGLDGGVDLGSVRTGGQVPVVSWTAGSSAEDHGR